MNDPDERTIRGEAMTYTERWAAGTAAHVLLVEAEAELAELREAVRAFLHVGPGEGRAAVDRLRQLIEEKE